MTPTAVPSVILRIEVWGGRVERARERDRERRVVRYRRIKTYVYLYPFSEQCLRTVWSYLFCRRLTIKLFTSYPLPPRTCMIWNIYFAHVSLSLSTCTPTFPINYAKDFSYFFSRVVFYARTHIHTLGHNRPSYNNREYYTTKRVFLSNIEINKRIERSACTRTYYLFGK